MKDSTLRYIILLLAIIYGQSQPLYAQNGQSSNYSLQVQTLAVASAAPSDYAGSPSFSLHQGMITKAASFKTQSGQYDLYPGIIFPNENAEPEYCTYNLYTTGCTAGDYIDDFILGDISNTGSGCSPNSYADFTNLSTMLAAGQSHVFSIKCGYENQRLTMWIDVDNDFAFDEDEKILNNAILPTADSTYTHQIYIPEGAPAGEHRLRLRTRWGNVITGPCDQFEFGETEDYTVNILPGNNFYCTENLYLNGCNLGDYLNDFKLEEISNTGTECSPDAYGNFTNQSTNLVAGQNYGITLSCGYVNQKAALWIDLNDDHQFTGDEKMLNNFDLPQSFEQYEATITIPANAPVGEHRMRVRTRYLQNPEDACAQYSYGEVEDYTVVISEPVSGYCIENLYTTGCGFGDGINSFILAGIENTNSGCSENGYVDFTNMNTTIITGAEYPISFSSNYNSQFVSVWVDLNNDFNFDEDEMIIDNLYLEYKNIMMTGDFMLPEDTPEGTYRLRARTNFAATCDAPCETYQYGEAEDYTINVIHPIVETQSIYLYEGWNGLSSYLEPTEDNMDLIFEELGDDLIIVQNMTGVYWPGQSINTFGGWDAGSGYQVKMNANAWINIEGNLIVPAALHLNEGWNMMPVYSPCSVNPDEFFAPSIEDIFIVKDIAGTGVYWPDLNINTLGNMLPGKSYLALLDKNTTLNFNSCLKNEEPEYHAPEIPEFNGKVVQATSATHTIAFADGDYHFNIGDAIGAFTADGEYAGFMMWTEKNRVITLFGDDPLTAEKEGFEEGAKIYFSRLDSKTGEITKPEFKFNTTQLNHDGKFHENGLSVISGISTTGIKNPANPEVVVYPNPVNDILNIKSDALILKIEVFSRQGMKIMEIEAGNTMETKLNAGQLPAGIYLLIIHTGDTVTNKKFVKLR